MPQLDDRQPSDAMILVLAGVCTAAFFAARRFLTAKPRYDLRQKSVLITGGSRGFGLALAEQFGRRGARLALCARDAKELDRACTQLRKIDIEAHAVPADITDPNQIHHVTEQTLSRLGSIDVLVNDAGNITVGEFESMTHQDFEAAMNLMFWAPVNLTLAVLPHMRARGTGRIVNVTSVGGRVAIPHLLPYSCAKFALVGFSTGLGAEVKDKGLVVHTVVPGLMRTGSHLQAQFKGAAKEEFAWFGLLGNLPGFSTAANEAAAQAVTAVERGEENCVISLPARALIALEALVPELLRHMLGLADQYLLPSGSGKASASGKHLTPKLNAVYEGLTALGRLAAIRWNEF